MKKTGFTLAEVLITLAIIGIVAAITIPSVIADSQKGEFVTGLQKAYNTISGALALSQAENGELTTWPWAMVGDSEGMKTFYQKFLMPYVKVSKDCNVSANEDCWTPGRAKYLKGEGSWSDYNLYATYYKAKLADGSSWAILSNPTCVTKPNYCAQIHVDTNGSKGPNVIGRDVFRIYVFPFTNQAVPLGIYTTPYLPEENTWTAFPEADYLSQCDSTAALSFGNTCGAKIQLEGWKMNY